VRGALVDTTLDELSPGEVVIRAVYSSVNYKDALAGTGTGKILRRFPLIAGIDVSGVVDSSTDSRFKPGDEVLVTGYDLGVQHDGGYAAYVRVPADWVVPIPVGLTLFEAMALGTAGFTAGLAIVRLEQMGLRPGSGPVIVTGATGGVGSVAVALLAALGHRVVAATGKASEAGYLRELGAAEILDRNTLSVAGKPLQKERWSAVIDAVGSHTLANALAQTRYGGVVAACGLAQGSDLPGTVLPFILRGVTLAGIDSVMAPIARRREAWERLARDIDPAALEAMTTEVPLGEAVANAHALMEGRVRGRVVVTI
jgi:acrylyl-CoA reductase (NADPH)